MFISNGFYKNFNLILLIILTLTITISAQDSLQNENAVKQLKESGQYDSLMRAYKKARQKDGETSAELAVGQNAQLLAPDGAAGDRFGSSVAIDGSTAVVGSPNDDFNRGSAYVFIRNDTVWSFQQKITASDGQTGELFGVSVDISGDLIIVGTPLEFGMPTGLDNTGAAYIFSRTSGVWTQDRKILASDRQHGDRFGQTVAISGNVVAIGAIGDGVGANANQGSVYIFNGAGTVWIEQTKLTASDGSANDFFGDSLAMDGNTVVVGVPRDDGSEHIDQGAVYVFVGSGTAWSQQINLTTPFNPLPSDFFGGSVAISGDTIVVGSRGTDVTLPDQGAAFVFVRSGTVWSFQQMLSDANGLTNDKFGGSVAISGNNIIVGAEQVGINTIVQGAAFFYTRSGTNWTLHNRFSSSDGAAFDGFGANVAISGNYMIVGLPNKHVVGNATQGSAYAFRVLSPTWRFNGYQAAFDPGFDDLFGTSVAISDNFAVVGVPHKTVFGGKDQGAAYVFVRNGENWVDEAKLTSSDGTPGDQFGVSVGIYGNSIIVGAPFKSIAGFTVGSAYIFSKVGGVAWVEQDQLVGSSGTGDFAFGFSVAMTSDTAVVGVNAITTTTDPGAAYVFKKSGASWNQEAYLTASDGEVGDYFGTSIAIYENTIVIGAERDNNGFDSDVGSAYIFTRTTGGTIWTQQAKIVASDGAEFDGCGQDVAISENTVAIGCWRDTGSFLEQGSVYIYTGSGASWTQQAKLTASNAQTNHHFGVSVSIEGNTLVVGTFPDFTSVGSAYIFERDGTTWTEKQILTNGIAFDQFGRAVAISGDKIIVGIPYSDASGPIPPAKNSIDSLVPTAVDQGAVAFYVNEPLAPTAANVSVGGKVLSSENRGLRNAIVTLTDTEGNSQTARTTTFGYFTFEEIEVGKTYILSVRAKKYSFAPRILTVNESVTDLVFTPE